MNALHHVTTLPAFFSHVTFRQCVEEVKKFHWGKTLWDSSTNKVSQDILEAFGKNLATAKEGASFLQNLKEKLQISKETTQKNYSKTACKVIQLFHTYFPSHLETFFLHPKQITTAFEQVLEEGRTLKEDAAQGVSFAIFEACKRGDLPALQLFLEEGGALEGKIKIEEKSVFWLKCLEVAITHRQIAILTYLKELRFPDGSYFIENEDLGAHLISALGNRDILKILAREDVECEDSNLSELIWEIYRAIPEESISEVLGILKNTKINFTEVLNFSMSRLKPVSSQIQLLEPLEVFKEEKEVVKVLMDFSSIPLEERWRCFLLLMNGKSFFQLLLIPSPLLSYLDIKYIQAAKTEVTALTSLFIPRDQIETLLNLYFESRVQYLFTERAHFWGDSLERAIFFELLELEEIPLEKKVNALLSLTDLKNLSELFERLFPNKTTFETTLRKRKREEQTI